MIFRFYILSLLIYTTGYSQNFRNGNWTSCGNKPTSFNPIQSRLNGSKEEINLGSFKATMIGLPTEALPAVESALSIWNDQLDSPVPIKIKLQWTSVGGNFLAKTRPTKYVKNFSKEVSRVIWYPISLAEKIAGKELNNYDDFEMEINLNEEINWHFRTEGIPPPEKYDLQSVLLHEIAHGLGFLSNAEEFENGIILSSDSYFTIYDHLLVTKDGARLINHNNNPSKLRELSSSNGVFIYSPSGNNTSLHQSYAPGIFLSGVSLSHFDNQSFEEGILMDPFIPSGWHNHTIDYATLDVLKNIGWRDKEPIQIRTYPTPATNYLTIEIPSILDEFHLNLYNLEGQLTFSGKPSKLLNSVLLIDTSSYPNGIYILKFTHPKQLFNQTVRISINH